MVQLKRKITLREKHIEKPVEQSVPKTESRETTEPPKPKLWIPILLGVLLIAGVGLYFLLNNKPANDGALFESDTTVSDNNPLPVSEENNVASATQTEVEEQNEIPLLSVEIEVKDETSASLNEKTMQNEVQSNVSRKTENADQSESVSSKSVEPATSNSVSTTLSEAEIEVKANEVIRGIYGNGNTRKIRLGEQYAVIQSKVNALYRSRK